MDELNDMTRAMSVLADAVSGLVKYPIRLNQPTQTMISGFVQTTVHQYGRLIDAWRTPVSAIQEVWPEYVGATDTQRWLLGSDGQPVTFPDGRTREDEDGVKTRQWLVQTVMGEPPAGTIVLDPLASLDQGRIAWRTALRMEYGLDGLPVTAIVEDPHDPSGSWRAVHSHVALDLAPGPGLTNLILAATPKGATDAGGRDPLAGLMWAKEQAFLAAIGDGWEMRLDGTAHLLERTGSDDV